MIQWFVRLTLVFGLFAVSIQSNAAVCDGNPITVNGSGSTFVIHFTAGCETDIANSIESAVQVYADYLVSSADIEIEMKYVNFLTTYGASHCTSSSGVLGFAGSNSGHINTANVPQTNTIYPQALANALAGSDVNTGEYDISAEFNSGIGTTGCLEGASWHFSDGSVAANTGAGEIDFYEVVLHEVAHGLGFSSWMNQAGQKNAGYNDVFSNFLMDNSASTALKDMATDAARASAMIDSGDLVWTGNEVNNGSSYLTSGLTAGKVRMYAPNPYESGSSVSHFDKVVTPNEIMEPTATSTGELTLTKALFRDLGWSTVSAAPTSNSAPVITGQNSITINEDGSRLVTLSDLNITDSDNAVPGDMTLTVSTGSNYSLSGNTVTPNANFNGSLTVPVKVNDGTDDSNTFNLSITVNGVNDAPVIDSQNTLAMNEDSSLTLTLSDLTVTDVDNSYPTGFTLTLSSGSNYSLSGNTITPSANYSGTLTVPAMVNDGVDDSNLFNLTVTVNAVNDAPVITSAASASATEGQSFSFAVAATDIDSAVSFSLSGQPGWLSINASTGVMSGTPTSSGTENFNVQASDGGASASQSFTLTVAAAGAPNQAPVITGQNAVSMNEDGLRTLSLSDLIITDADSAVPGDMSLSVGTGDNYHLEGLAIKPVSNFNGTLTVPVTVSDGEDSSAEFTLSVVVNAVNDAPVITSENTITLVAGESIDFQVTADDVDNASLTYSLEDAPEWLEIESTTGELSGVAAESGVIDLFTLVSDGNITVEQELTINITEAASGGDLASDLAITVTADNSLTEIGEVLRADFTVSSAGPDSGYATLKIMLNDLSLSDFDSACNLMGDYLECYYSNLDPEQSHTTWVEVTSNSAAQFALVAELENGLVEIDDSNNRVEVALTFKDPQVAEPESTVPGFGRGNTRVMAVADVQGDNKPEIILANGPGESTTIFRFNDSFSALSLHSHLNDSADSHGLAVSDFNGDGNHDLVLANGSNQGNTIWLNDGAGFFANSSSLGNSDSRDVAIGDFDGDGLNDLVFANAQGQANTVYLNDGDGTFTLIAELGSYDSRAVFVFDFDFDGDPDILVANYGYYNLLYINQRVSRSPGVVTTKSLSGSAFGSDSTLSLGGAASYTNDINILDSDNDGNWDQLVVANDADEDNGSVEVYSPSADGSDVELTATLAAGSSKSVSAGDYDGDGDADLAVLGEDGVVQILLREASGEFSVGPVVESRSGSTVVLEDLDGNGEADLLVGNDDASGSDLYLLGAVESNRDTSANTGSSDSTRSSSGSSSGGSIDWWVLALITLLTLVTRQWARQK